MPQSSLLDSRQWDLMPMAAVACPCHSYRLSHASHASSSQLGSERTYTVMATQQKP
jgi:hypothetical protein